MDLQLGYLVRGNINMILGLLMSVEHRELYSVSCDKP